MDDFLLSQKVHASLWEAYGFLSSSSASLSMSPVAVSFFLFPYSLLTSWLHKEHMLFTSCSFR